MENINGNLPKELVNEILLRLPVKTLLVCKCVCKEWCGLIKSSSFVNRHFSHESNQDCLLYRSYSMAEFSDEREYQYVYAMYEDDERHSQVEVSNHLTQMPTDNRASELMGPENGVFCVVSNHKHIGLFNPAIREFKTLPRHPLHGSISISFMVGFGLDPSSGDFKVVAFEESLTLYGNLTFVYNLSSDSWKRIQAAEVLDLFVLGGYSSRNQILNGVNHWIMNVASDISSILAFDTRNEMFQEISVPDALSNTRVYDLHITEYGDSIAVMSCKDEERVDLWVMGRDGLWSKSFIIGPFQGCDLLLRVWKKNMVFFESSSSPLKMCDISTQKVITLIPETTDPDFVCDHFIYKESLVSIKGERADCVLDFYDQI